MRSTLVVAVATSAVLVLLLVWGASNGTPLVGDFADRPLGVPALTAPEAVPTVEAGPEADGEQQDEQSDESLTRGLFNLAVGLFLMAVLTAFLLVLRWAGERRLESDEHRAMAEDEELVAVLEATSDEVRYQALSEGDPRNAVVACWVALEEAAQRSGLTQDRAETAAELTERVLARWDVDTAAIHALAEAYREARFSRHDVTEQQRDSAVAALERIHTDLRRRAEAHAQIGDGGPS